MLGTVEDGMRAVIDEMMALLYAGLVTNGIIISQKPYTHPYIMINSQILCANPTFSSVA